MIVVAYSFAHFHPKHRATPVGSAGAIAKIIFDEAIKFAGTENVLYIDPDVPESWGPSMSVEALISRASNYSGLLNHFKPEKNLLIAVNQHPVVRKNIRKLLKISGIPARAIDATDGVFESSKQIRPASKVLLVGNGVTRETYLRNGFLSQNVFPITYTPPAIDYEYKSHDGTMILAHMGSIGFRKGADVVIDIADMLRESKSIFKVILTGEPVNEFWSECLKKAIERNPDHLQHIGWVNPKSETFIELLGKTKFAIFPTREEGLSGAFLEIANSGMPVLTTHQVGIETIAELVSVLGEEFILRVKSLTIMGNKEIQDISQSSKKWFDSIKDSSEQLPEAINRFLSHGKIWPKADVKLCVHNKNKTIGNLISGWSKAAKLTDNTSITVIDDGSTDLSANSIRDALKNSSGFQENKLLFMPDVFEVKSNNAAILATQADYHIIVQDDNHIVNYDLLPEMLALADKSRNIAALGGLAGANFYPLAKTCSQHVPGQHACGEYEHYWRQDQETDVEFLNRYFEVDAVMRGPLLMSNKALVALGILDESYAPLYMDDVEWCARARSKQWRVVAMLGGVVNKSESMNNASVAQNLVYQEAYKRNTLKFYSSYEVTEKKSHLEVVRFTWASSRTPVITQLRLLLIPEIRSYPQKCRNYIYVKSPKTARLMQVIKHRLVGQ